MGICILIAGLVIGAFFPLLVLLGGITHDLMGCSGGGSSGPVGGCRFLGIEFNLIAAMATPAFVASFFTVPIGGILFFIGLVMSAFDSGDQEKDSAE